MININILSLMVNVVKFTVRVCIIYLQNIVFFYTSFQNAYKNLKYIKKTLEKFLYIW